MSRIVTKTITKEVNQLVINIDPLLKTQYKEAFDMIDTTNSGVISIDQIRKLLKKFGQSVSREEVRDMIKDLDNDNSGTLTFEEFISLMTKQTIEEKIDVVEKIDDEDIVIKAFRTFDSDNDGIISIDDFRFILTKIAQKWSDQEADEVFKMCELNKDGKLEFVGFVNFWRKVMNKPYIKRY